MSLTEETKDHIISETKQILNRNKERDAKLLSICELLEKEIATFDWVGFYFADPEGKQELHLGPYVGEATDHTRIPFGRGICGQVPIMKGDAFVAQIDIDSNTRGSITKEQRELLEEIAQLLGSEF